MAFEGWVVETLYLFSNFFLIINIFSLNFRGLIRTFLSFTWYFIIFLFSWLFREIIFDNSWVRIFFFFGFLCFWSKKSTEPISLKKAFLLALKEKSKFCLIYCEKNKCNSKLTCYNRCLLFCHFRYFLSYSFCNFCCFRLIHNFSLSFCSLYLFSHFYSCIDWLGRWRRRRIWWCLFLIYKSLVRPYSFL